MLLLGTLQQRLQASKSYIKCGISFGSVPSVDVCGQVIVERVNIVLEAEMGATWNAEDPMPETIERTDFARQQEIQCLKDYYEAQIRVLQDTHKKEKRALKQENQRLKNDIRVQKIKNTKLGHKYETLVCADMDLQTELQQVKLSMRKLQEDKDVEIIEIRHGREKRTLMEKIRELKDFVRSLKMANNNLKKDRAERMQIQEELQEELRTFKVANNELKIKCDTVMGTEVELRTELERVRVANRNLNEYWELKMKYCEEEKKILVIRNQELQKELEAAKTNVPEQNLQLVGCSSQPQEGCQCGITTADDGKVTLDNFQFIRRLGEGTFGTVVLTRGKLPGGPEQLFAIKAIKKRGITSSNIRAIMTEKEALMLTSGHPYITTLYSCFQNKDHLFFVMEYMSGGDLMAQLDEVQVFSEERAKFYAAEITLAVQFLHQHGILHRDLKLENVLVGSDGHCKIADFGLSRLGLFRRCEARTRCGTLFCMAPEIVKNLPYGQGADWWAVGVMLFEMLTGEPPFYYDERDDSGDPETRKKLCKKILEDEVDIPDNMSLAAASIVLKFLMKDPKQRLGSNGSVNTVRHHPFFKGIDWKALQEKRVKPPEKEKVAGKSEEDNKRLSKVLRDDNTSGNINRKLFQGFSFINYFVKQG